jgi:plastocyanin
MKRILTLILTLALTQAVFATIHTVNILGTTYVPATTNALVGDTVIIEASGNHPLVQVDLATWTANGNTPMGGGWGTKTAPYQFTITTLGDIYFVCSNHVASMGMKGKITVSTPSSVDERTIGSLISVFPTPAENGNFSVITGANAPEGLSLEIYNTTGQIIEKHSLVAGVNSLATTAPAGAYLYAVTNNKNVVYRTGKLLITR